MAKQPAVPSLTGDSGVEVRKQVNTVYLTECPKCKTDLDVTNVTFGTHIQCPNCQNITYRLDYTPPWWVKAIDKGWKAILAIIFTFGLGFLSSYFATSVYEDRNNDKIENSTESQTESTNIKKLEENGN